MIKVLDSSLNTLTILDNVINPIISEELNREYTFTFTTVIDNDKSSYVNYQNKVEVEGNYFNIVYTEEERTQDGVFIRADCEHVSYDLLSANFTAGFTAIGLFSAVATTILAGTGFTVGTVASTATETISVLEATNARQLLLSWAALHGGEIEWDKYTINQVAQRGANRGVQFRYRKNLVGVKRITDNRTKTDAGLPTISYQVSPAELEFEQGFIGAGIAANEHYELGDTVHVVDEDLGLDAEFRIVKESHDTEQRMIGTIEIANFVEDLTDGLTRIQTTSVSKDNVYNGCSIGPDLGFVATRSDNLARSLMNATDGIKIQKGDGTGTNWTDVIFLDTSGNATFSGSVIGSSFRSGSAGSSSYVEIDTGDSPITIVSNDVIALELWTSTNFGLDGSGGSIQFYDITADEARGNIGAFNGTIGSAYDGLIINAENSAATTQDIVMLGDNIRIAAETGITFQPAVAAFSPINMFGDVTITRALDVSDISADITIHGDTIITGNATINGTLSVSDILYSATFTISPNLTIANNIGFFGSPPVSQTTVANQSSTTSISTVLAKLNELIDALQSYNLV